MEKKTQEVKYVSLWLGYFKQGDDFSNHLNEEGTNVYEAIQGHIAQLQAVVEHLKEVGTYVEGRVDLQADAMTHHIGIAMPAELADKLIEKELVFYDEELDEEWLDDDEFIEECEGNWEEEECECGKCCGECQEEKKP